MTVLKCKMCGGTLEVQEGVTVCECDYCGSKQTIPTVDDEGLQTLFNRANMLRMKSEFDKAADIYEKILLKKDTEAEAYWGLILCKYGIEYVEDPNTYLRVPTCHRTSYEAISADEDYKNALKYAEIGQRAIYEDEARRIEDIQKGILNIARKEDPYDIFICYKETDEAGKRTPDSVIANDIYHQLTQDGFKVFYAAITLEDKLGTEYEPYIFSALNTSKVMLAIGTKPEYFNAVWVKNEWARFLKIMKTDHSRLLIPCYRDMDPYELPEEFAHLQAQDMSKIGFINDIIRGIKKVIVKESVQPVIKASLATQQSTGSTTATAQIKRGNIALEDHEWDKADGFFEAALDIDPECSGAYLGKLLAKEKSANWESLCKTYLYRYLQVAPISMEVFFEDNDVNEHIEKIVRQYCIEPYLGESAIRSMYTFDRSYIAYLPKRTLQKKEWEKMISSDRLLVRARQYAKGKDKQIIEDGLAEITKTLNDRITQAQEEDNEKIESVKKAYAAHIAAVDEKVVSFNKDAQKRREESIVLKSEKEVYEKQKANLLAEIASIKAQIKDDVAIGKVPAEDEKWNIMNQISELRERRSKLGFLSGNKKKQLLDEIVMLEKKMPIILEKIHEEKTAKKELLDKELVELQKQLAPVDRRIGDIEKELKKNSWVRFRENNGL